MKLEDRVFKIVSQVMNVPVTNLNMESSIDTIEEWDSLQHMNLVLALEEEFGIQFTDEQILEILSIELIIEIVSDALQT